MTLTIEQAKLGKFSPVQRDQMLKIIDFARWAPSGDNCQPWKFEVLTEGLLVHYIKERGAHALNNHDHATYMTLGTLAEIIEVAATNDKLKPGFQILEVSDLGGPIMKVVFQSFDCEPDPRTEAIIKRCTDRRVFRTEAIDLTDLEHLKDISTDFSNCTLKFNDKPSIDLINYFIRSDEFMWLHKEVLEDLFNLVRFSSTEFNSTFNGMPWQNLGVKWIEVPMFKALRKNPLLPQKLWKFGFQKNVNGLSRRALKNCGGLIGFSVKDNSKESVFNAGRLAMRAWLYLTMKGYSLQPLSLGSLTAFDFLSGKAPEYANPDFKLHFKEGLKHWRQEFKLQDSWLPIWCLRVGRPKFKTEIFRTRRFPVYELIK